MRNVVIGDIHGCNELLKRLLFQIDIQPQDTIITLGDYIDRGPDSHGVVETLIDLQQHCNLISLRGNHEDLLLRSDEVELQMTWLHNGAGATIDSYVKATLFEGNLTSIYDVVPPHHVQFFKSCKLYHEDDNNIFCHANYDPAIDMHLQSENDLLWKHAKNMSIPGPHQSGKKAWVGHTPQKDSTITDLGHISLIDVGSSRSGRLAAVDTISGKTWYAS